MLQITDPRWDVQVTSEQNRVLAKLLTELNWSPRTLARRINRLYGPGTVAESAPYHWLGGSVPRPPLPTHAASVLTREVGREVSVEELWQGRAGTAPLSVTAVTNMQQPWSRDGALSVLDDWLVSGMLDRRQFLTVTGSSLAAAIADYDPDKVERLSSAVTGGKISNTLLEQIEQSIPLLQRLDDAKGGGANLTYIGAQFRAVGVVLRQGGHDGKTERRLFACLAELGQLAGWMAFDAGHHGLAQRYFFTTLRMASEAGSRSMAAHVLADLSFQAASSEQARDAITLGNAAKQAASRVPATVQASVLSRAAYGHAVAGDLPEFERTYQQGRSTLEKQGQHEPSWMYFLTANHLDTQAGYALVHAGSRALDSGDRAEARPLLSRGQQLLRTGAHAASLHDQTQQRRAMFEGAWLAVAAACRGDLEEACTEGQQAVARAGTVTSARSLEVLRTLSTRLRRRRQNEYVADFLPVLDSAITGTLPEEHSRWPAGPAR